MKKLVMRMSGLLCLALLFALGLSGTKVQAADVTGKVDKITYLKDENTIALMIEEFSETDYTYSINDGVEKEVAGGKNAYAITIPDAKAGEVYTLTFTAKDSKDYIKVKYFTGNTISGMSTVNNDTRITSKWSYAGETELEYTLANPYQTKTLKIYKATKVAAGESSYSMTAASNLKPADYGSYVVAVNKDGAYGAGAFVRFTYVPKPGKPSLTVKRGRESASLSWTSAKNASGYQVKYKKAGGNYTYLDKSTTKRSLKASNLTEGKTYYFAVRAYTKVGSKTVTGSWSAVKSVKIPIVAKKVKGVKFSLNSAAQVIMSWNKTKYATSYQVYYKKSSTSKYKLLGTTKTTRYNLKKLDMMETYDLIVYAKTDEIRSAKHSSKVVLSPSSSVNKNKMKKLAAKVRTIGYTKKGCVYTKKKYSKEVKEAYVNYNGYRSRTKYLIFVSLYTQQATIYKGYRKHWRQFRTFTIAGGSFENRTPRGKFKIFKKEYVWMHPDTETRYISHFYKKASFHARPMYHNGKIQAPTLGRPISNACVRCPTEQAIFIYKHIPIGTFVRSI